MKITDAFQAGRAALRGARADQGDSYDPTAFAAGVDAVACWASPRQFDESIFDTEALLMFVGEPTRGNDGIFLLESSVGPAPLTRDQKHVIDQIIEAGAWATGANIGPSLRPTALHMLNTGLLYALSGHDTGLYRNDLVPVPRPEAGNGVRKIDDGQSLGSMIIVTPRGSDHGSEFPVLSLAVWSSLDGYRTAEQAVIHAGDFGSKAFAKAAKADGATVTEATDHLAQMLFIGIIALAQAGFFYLDIRTNDSPTAQGADNPLT